MNTKELQKLIQSKLGGHKELTMYAKNRKRDKDLPYIPNYHFSSPGGYLNDPCGLCYIDGLYHLFYQFCPEHHNQLSWGHAVSVDMIHWQDLPIAVEPTYEECCGSGGALVVGNDLYFSYQGPTKDNPTEGAIHIAKGSGCLFETWEKLFGGPVICHKRAFDPCMWEENGKFYLLSAGGGSLPHPDNVKCPEHRKFYLYESDDLEHWTFRHNFIENDRYAALGDDGACPYFLPFGDGRYILLHFSHKSGGQWIIGEYDRERMKFIATDGGPFNSNGWGAGGVHAPSAFVDDENGIVTIFNVNYGHIQGPTNQIMGLPRRFTPDKDGRPYAEPWGNYQSLRKRHIAEADVACKANEEVMLKGNGRCFELEITADVAKPTDANGFIPSNMLPVLELRVLRSADAKEHTDIRFFRNRTKMNWAEYDRLGTWGNGFDSVMEIDLSSSTLGNFWVRPTEATQMTHSPFEPIKLHVFVDKSIVEVFADGKCIAVRTYPSLEDSVGISVIAKGVDAVMSYDFWELDIKEGEE